MATEQENDQTGETLESWKAIANYLQRRVRTVQRWERDEALPVHRHQHKKQATVYAYTDELDAWRASRDRSPVESPAPNPWVRRFAIAASVMSFITVAYFLEQNENSETVQTDKSMMVILPFVDLSPGQLPELLGDGLTEELSTQMARLAPEQMGVIARTSAMSYKDKNFSVDVIGQQLEVDYVLEGSVRREGNRVRVTAQLIETQQQSHVWAEDYDLQFDGLLSLQESATREIVRDIGVVLDLGDGGKLSFADHNEQAYEQLLLGQHYFGNWGGRQMPQAIEHFNRAIEIDAEFAEAYLNLSLSYNVLTFFRGIPLRQGYQKARSAATRALELDPENGLAHALLGWILFAYDWQWQEAEKQMTRGIQLSPNSPWAHSLYGNYLSAMGRGKPAVEHMQIANRLDPLSPHTNIMLGYVFTNAGLFDEAVAKLEYSNEVFAGRPAVGFLIVAHALSGDFERAIATIEESNVDLAAQLRDAYSRKGEQGYWQVTANQQETILNRQPEYFSWWAAYVRLKLGNVDGAIEMLEKGYHQRRGDMAYLLAYPFDALHNDPRYQDLLRQMNLMQPPAQSLQ